MLIHSALFPAYFIHLSIHPSLIGFILVGDLRRVQIQNQMREIIILCRRDLLVFKDLLVNKEKKEKEGPGESPGLLAHLDHLEKE